MLTAVAAILSVVLAVVAASPPWLPSAIQPPLPPRIAPGDSVLRSSWRTADSVRYALTMFRDADEIPVGQLVDVWRPDTIGGVPVVVRVQRLQRGTVQLVDTTVTDQHTLAPRTRRSLQQNRRVLLEFNGARVRGSLAPLDAPPVPLDTTLRVAPFDAGNWELLLRALPLEKDFAARFPVYDLDGGLREYRVNVTGRTPVQGEDCHVVVLTLARNRESVVWVSVATGQVVQIETMLGETTLLRQVRVLR
jgi:hypothetical protein